MTQASAPCLPSGSPLRWVAGAAGPPDGPYDADIVILAFDRPHETLAAIQSALAQQAARVHVFVLDQGSAPATLDRFATALAGQPRATLVAADRNYGVAQGRNLVSSLGHGRTIVALDNDAEFADAETVAHLVAALDAEPALAAVGCRIVSYDTGRDDLTSWGYPAALLPCAGEAFDTVTYVGAGHAIRRAAWESVGGYDGRLFFCWEELDFCRRAIAAGWRIRYRGDITIRHKVSGERRFAWSASRWFYFVRNRLYIERKLGAGRVALLPRTLGYLVKALRHGLLWPTLRAIVAAERMAPVGSHCIAVSPAARQYILRNDRWPRGSLLTRLRTEVLGRLAAASPAAE